MEIIDLCIAWLNSNWKAITATVSLIFTLYFARQKIGNKLSLSYEVSMGRYSDQQITKLVVSNRKDKTVSIWSIYAVIENDIKFDVYSPDIPLVLKSGESISIAPKRYSYLTLNDDRFTPKLMLGKIHFYAHLGDRVVKCIDEKVNSNILSALATARKTTISLDDHIYDETVRFILVYYFDGVKKYAFFEDGGLIGHEWGMHPNHMGKADYTADDIKYLLEHYGFEQMFSNFVCFENLFENKEFKVAFRKKNT